MKFFLERGSQQFRSDFNRLVVPYDVRKRKWSPLNIMWTPMSLNGQIVHFGPLLERNSKEDEIDIWVDYSLCLIYTVGISSVKIYWCDETLSE